MVCKCKASLNTRTQLEETPLELVRANLHRYISEKESFMKIQDLSYSNSLVFIFYLVILNIIEQTSSIANNSVFEIPILSRSILSTT
jgi:hypothetical protein